MSKMKVTWGAIALLLVAMLAVASCTPAAAPSAAPTKAAGEAKPATEAKPAAGAVNLKLAAFYPETDAFAEGVKVWIKSVSDKTGGRVQITPYWAGSLVSLADSFDAVREGSADIANVVAAAHSGKIPDLSAWEPVGAYPVGDKYLAALDKTDPVMKAIFDEQKIVFLWQQFSPGVVIITKTKHVKGPDDYKGLKVRAAGRWQSSQMKALGASPVALDPGEQYMAIQTGTVDGALSVNNLVLSLKLDEVAPYITEYGMAVNLTTYAMNKGAWDKLSDADKKAIQEASSAAERAVVPGLMDFQAKAVKTLEGKGAKIYNLTPQEQAAFYKGTEAMWNEMRGAVGANGKQLMDILAQYR